MRLAAPCFLTTQHNFLIGLYMKLATLQMYCRNRGGLGYFVRGRRALGFWRWAAWARILEGGSVGF